MKLIMPNSMLAKIIKKQKYILPVVAFVLFFVSCKRYLDVVPDNVAVLDNAFTLRVEAEKFLHTCYSFLPDNANPQANIAFAAGDECWVPNIIRWQFNQDLWGIARGYQNKDNPYANFWDGTRWGKPYFVALRNCNIFLENVGDYNKVSNLQLDERIRWLGEVEFLKAFYHYYLVQLYGPIPIIDKNLPITASTEEVRVKRQSVDSCISYISILLDSAAAKLPANVTTESKEFGRITKPIALALKAKVLLLGASPLFNGNTDFSSLKNENGVTLVNQTYDETKWAKAAAAAKEAIDAAEDAGYKLYQFTNQPYPLSDTTKIQLSIRNAFSERWNGEVIWANTNNRAVFMQQVTMGKISETVTQGQSITATSQVFPTMKMAELFYTKNGVPINEDKTLDFSKYNTLRKAVHSERFNISEGYETARLNFDRENRFYANLGFDGGIWFMYNTPSRTDENTFVMKAKKGQYGNEISYGLYSETGYFIKKIPNWQSVFETGATLREYPWPEIRLADLYLIYAEALNESIGPVEAVHEYLNKIRNRAALPTIKESWDTYSRIPSKYTTKDGMRSIIHQERLIELAFEGQRYWDLRRWKQANIELNKPVKGWTISASDALSYYQTRVIFQQHFIAPRDYLWPVRQYNRTVNPNLSQNPGW